jgi:uncharacterized protein (TIGR02453 family)
MLFSSETFLFLRQLKRHNNREWFERHRDRYVAHVETPMLAFIREVGERLPSISPAYVGDPRRSGGSMFRIYRDTRFSADKSPYKTWVAARFGHRSASQDVHAPGFYFHLAPDERYGGGGIYHPDTATLTRIRERICARPREWAAVLETGIEIEGDRLQRPPNGYDRSHRFVEDLKRKDLYALAEFTEADVLSPAFVDRYLESCRQVAPLVEFITRSLGLRW